jgi:hypothetical protein
MPTGSMWEEAEGMAEQQVGRSGSNVITQRPTESIITFLQAVWTVFVIALAMDETLAQAVAAVITASSFIWSMIFNEGS